MNSLSNIHKNLSENVVDVKWRLIEAKKAIVGDLIDLRKMENELADLDTAKPWKIFVDEVEKSTQDVTLSEMKRKAPELYERIIHEGIPMTELSLKEQEIFRDFQETARMLLGGTQIILRFDDGDSKTVTFVARFADKSFKITMSEEGPQGSYESIVDSLFQSFRYQ